MANGHSYKPFVVSNFIFFFVVSIIQIAFASLTYSFSRNYNVGAFYVGTFTFLLFLTVFAVQTLCGRILYGIFSFICFLLALVGGIIDLSAAGLFNSLKTCANSDGEYFGQEEYEDVVLFACHVDDRTQDNACFCTAYDYRDPDDALWDTCYLFIEQDGFSADNCSPILDEYGRLAATSAWLCLLLSVACLVHSIIICSSCCCKCLKFDSDQTLVVPVSSDELAGTPLRYNAPSDQGGPTVPGGHPGGQMMMVPIHQPPYAAQYQQPFGQPIQQYNQQYGQQYGQQPMQGGSTAPHVVIIHQTGNTPPVPQAPEPEPALLALAGVRVIEDDMDGDRKGPYNGGVAVAKAI